MANIRARDLDDDVPETAEGRGQTHRRSLQAEIHDVLHQAGTRSLAEISR